MQAGRLYCHTSKFLFCGLQKIDNVILSKVAESPGVLSCSRLLAVEMFKLRMFFSKIRRSRDFNSEKGNSII